MNKQEMLEALRHVADGSLSPEDMLARLKQAPFEDIGCANIDYHRGVRQFKGRLKLGIHIVHPQFHTANRSGIEQVG